jgi:type I restriction enzyme S subunit
MRIADGEIKQNCARYNKAKAQVDKLPQSLLAKAFRGELVSQDENDEPASVLLERIRINKIKDKPNEHSKADRKLIIV